MACSARASLKRRLDDYWLFIKDNDLGEQFSAWLKVRRELVGKLRVVNHTKEF